MKPGPEIQIGFIDLGNRIHHEIDESDDGHHPIKETFTKTPTIETNHIALNIFNPMFVHLAANK